MTKMIDKRDAGISRSLETDHGEHDAQSNLGSIPSNVFGEPRDDKALLKSYQLAANRGERDAQFNLGAIHARCLN